MGVLPKRQIIVDGDVARVPLGNNGKDGWAIIDTFNLHLAMPHNWHNNGLNYAVAKHEGKKIKLHHLIIGEPKNGLVTDHINRNRLDNRVCNLRHVTQRKNCENASLRSDNSSGYKGVGFCKQTNKWKSRVTINGKRNYLGLFDTAEEAAKVIENFHRKYDAVYVKGGV